MERLLPAQEATTRNPADVGSDSAGDGVSDGAGEAIDEAKANKASCGPPRDGRIVNKNEDALLRQRGQGQSSPPSSSFGADATSGGGVKEGSGGDHLV